MSGNDHHVPSRKTLAPKNFASLASVSHGLEYLRKEGLGLKELMFDTARKQDKPADLPKLITKKDIFVVAETAEGVFSGYAPLSGCPDLASQTSYFHCQESFLAFSITKTVYTPITNGPHDMCYYKPLNCVSFGGGHQLHLGQGDTWSGAYINPHPSSWNTPTSDFKRTNLTVKRVYVFQVGKGKGAPFHGGGVDVGLCMHPAINHDEYDQLCIMSGDMHFEADKQAVFGTEKESEGNTTATWGSTLTVKPDVLCNILRSNTRIITVKCPDALSALANALCSKETESAKSESCVTQLNIEFSEVADTKHICTVMQNLGAFANVVTAPCPSRSHAKSLVQAVSTSAEKIKGLELRNCEDIEGAGLEELKALSKEKHLKYLVFPAIPKEVTGYTHLIMELARKHPDLDVKTDCTADDLPVLTKGIVIPRGLEPGDQFNVKMLPFDTTTLPDKSVGFYCWTAASSSAPSTAMIMCFPEDAAIACSNLLLNFSEDGAIPPMSPHPQRLPSEALVKLLIRYMIYAKQYVPDALREEEEAQFRISVRDDMFLQLMAEETASIANDRRVTLMVALYLLHMASYLQMPSLKRLLRSFIIQTDVDVSDFGVKK